PRPAPARAQPSTRSNMRARAAIGSCPQELRTRRRRSAKEMPSSKQPPNAPPPACTRVVLQPPLFGALAAGVGAAVELLDVVPVGALLPAAGVAGRPALAAGAVLMGVLEDPAALGAGAAVAPAAGPAWMPPLPAPVITTTLPAAPAVALAAPPWPPTAAA